MRSAGLLLLACAICAALPAAGRAETRIHGIEADSTPEEDRLLVLADGVLDWRLERDDPRTTQLVLRDARLDPGAPRRVSGRAGSAWSLASVTEKSEGVPEVRIRLRHRPGAVGRVSRRDTQLAWVFDRQSVPSARAPDLRRPAPPPPDANLQIRQLNGDVRELLLKLARFAGVELFFDDSLTGRVSIDAPAPVSREEARALIDALLLLKGFALLPTPGGVQKVVPVAGAQGEFVRSLPQDPNEVPLVTIVLLEEIDAALVDQALRPLVGEAGLIVPHPSANGLILGGPGHRLRRLVEIVRELDELGPRQLVILNLYHADALATADALDQAFDASNLEVWPDERTNRLIVRGRPDRVEAARAFVTRIDRPAVGHGSIEVLPLRFGDPQRAAEVLTALRGGGSAAEDATASARGAGSLAGREFRVSVHAPTRSLVVQADAETMDLIQGVLAEIDREPARIDVEVSVVEVSTDHSLTIGFDALVPIVEPKQLNDLLVAALLNPSPAVLDANPLLGNPGSSLYATITGKPVVIPIVDAMGNPSSLVIPLDANALTLDEREVYSQVLLRPQLSLLSGQSNEIFAGDNVPIPIADTATQGSALQTRQNIERRDVGVSLRVEPTLGADDGVVLALRLDVSRVSDSAVQSVSRVGPTIRERSLESTIRLQAGQSAVIGFALTPTSTQVEAGTPFLKDIPILGWAFRTQVSKQLDNSLILVARAEVHRPESEALSDWLDRRLRAGAELAEAGRRP